MSSVAGGARKGGSRAWVRGRGVGTAWKRGRGRDSEVFIGWNLEVGLYSMGNQEPLEDFYGDG